MAPLVPQLISRLGNRASSVNGPTVNQGLEITVLLVSSSHLELLGMS